MNVCSWESEFVSVPVKLHDSPVARQLVLVRLDAASKRLPSLGPVVAAGSGASSLGVTGMIVGCMGTLTVGATASSGDGVG